MIMHSYYRATKVARVCQHRGASIRGAAERFISDKARIASVLNSFKNDPFYIHLVTLFTKEFSI